MAIVDHDPINWTKLARDWPHLIAKKGQEIAEKRRKEGARATKPER